MVTRAVWISVLVMLAAAPVTALEPAELVVVVNRAMGESVALGRFYCDKRGVPPQNLIALDLPTTDTISAPDYDRKLREPLRQALADLGMTDRVRCVLTVRGVPFRIEPGDPPAEITRIMDWYRAAADRAQQRLARNIILMDVVGSRFPPTATGQTDPADLEGLFGGFPSVPEELPAVPALRGRFSQLARQKAVEVGRIADPTQREIAIRQIVGLYLDTYGQLGWESIAELLGDQGQMIPADYKKKAAAGHQEALSLMQVKRPDESVFAKIEALMLSSDGVVGMYESLLKMALKTGDRVAIDSRAAVDSELSLLLWSEYPREAWLDNPLLWVSRGSRAKVERQFGRTLMTARIDGPTVQSVMRLVLDAIATEQAGLTGTLYIDAGAMKHKPFEASLLDLAEGISRKTDIPVVLDTSIMQFRPGACPEAALYAGWYNPRQYVASFTWQRGAVAYHLAEMEALELRDPNSHQWVPRMIAEGVTVTVGAAEPTPVTALPPPGWFLAMVMSGRLTVCEAYWRAVPNASWRVMLIADPLYTPFKTNPQKLGLPDAMFAEAAN